MSKGKAPSASWIQRSVDLQRMKRIIPILFVSAASCVVLVSCAQPNARVTHTGRPATANPGSGPATTTVSNGRALFLKNCAHCHGADARGDEGPDLHNLDWTDEQIVTRVRNGKKGQMTAFAGKFSPDQISDVVAYLRSLH
jgi:mono/diheme cytochrome c family protein